MKWRKSRQTKQRWWLAAVLDEEKRLPDEDSNLG
jgi:hypothetical protein